MAQCLLQRHEIMDSGGPRDFPQWGQIFFGQWANRANSEEQADRANSLALRSESVGQKLKSMGQKLSMGRKPKNQNQWGLKG